MRLDAMLGKTTVGIEKKIQEPTAEEARCIAEELKNRPRHLSNPYGIPSAILMEHSEMQEHKVTER